MRFSSKKTGVDDLDDLENRGRQVEIRLMQLYPYEHLHRLAKVLAVLLFSSTLFFSCSSLFQTEKPFVGETESGVSFAVVGDVMVHAPQLTSSYYEECQCHDFRPVFAPVAPYIKKADLAIANLETTLPGDPSQYSGYPQFGAPDSLIQALYDAGFDILTTANNHSVDKGKSGLVRTIRSVRQMGFLQLGTYFSDADYAENRILMLERGGMEFALLNYTYGTNGLPVPEGTHVNLIEKELIARDIAMARKRGADAIVVLYHFGGEYLRYPDDFQKEMVAHAIDQGADIILGGHPHVLQPFEVIRARDRYGKNADRLVIYSLGNFVSNQQRRFTDGGMIFRFRVRKNPDGPGLIYGQVGYKPVWVYVATENGKKRHYVLPADEYMQPTGKGAELPTRSKRLLKRFYTDTTEHLQPSVEALRKYEQSLTRDRSETGPKN